MESLYTPGEGADSGLDRRATSDEAANKANELILPEGRRR